MAGSTGRACGFGDVTSNMPWCTITSPLSISSWTHYNQKFLVSAGAGTLSNGHGWGGLTAPSGTFYLAFQARASVGVAARACACAIACACACCALRVDD